MRARMIFYLRCAAYLRPLRELANSKTAVGSDTLTRSGYARSDHENQSTALPWSFDSSLFYLHSGDVSAVHAYNIV